jgi:hypothetical protein
MALDLNITKHKYAYILNILIIIHLIYILNFNINLFKLALLQIYKLYNILFKEQKLAQCMGNGKEEEK